QYQDGSVLQDGSCNGESLALSTRQTRSTFADQRVKPLGQLLNKFRGVGYTRSAPYRCHISVNETVISDVAGNRVVKQGDMLIYQRDLLAQIRQAKLLQRNSVDADFTFTAVIKTTQ